jgi:hypothetical protein
MSISGGRSRNSYLIADVVNILRNGTPREQYEVTRYFPGLVNALLADPMGAFAVTFGHKRADGCEIKVRHVIGVTFNDEPVAEDDSQQPDNVEAAPAAPQVPEPVVPSGPGKKKSKGKAKASAQRPQGEDSVDAILNQLDPTPTSPTSTETIGDDD